MQGVLREICALSILCGVAMSITPEVGAKRVIGILSSAILIIAIITPLRAFDFESYALELAKYKADEAELTAKGEEMSERLNRLVIEQECRAYIMDKAAEMGFEVKEAKVTLKWSTEGVWVPYSAEVSGTFTSEERLRLCESIEAGLGIPGERVVWANNE